jgi:hypothetical protein
VFENNYFHPLMQRCQLLKKIYAFAFTVMVLFTVSVREMHYLFSQHHGQHEHCENHLHSKDEHGDCSVCKFDISIFSNDILPRPYHHNFFTTHNSFFYRSVKRISDVYTKHLRGPPSLIA